MSTKPTPGPSIIIDFPTAELQALREVLQNEMAWDRNPDTGGADNPVYEEAKRKVLNSAMLRIDIELERRKHTERVRCEQEKFNRQFPELPAGQTDQAGETA